MPIINEFDEIKRLKLKNHPKPNFELSSPIATNEVTFKLFNKENEVGGKDVTRETIESAIIHQNSKTKLFIHGWLGSSERLWYSALKNEYLKTGDLNIIYVDWAKPAQLSYTVSCASVEVIAERIAHVLIESKICADQIHLIGHSLGAQVAGFTGKAYKKLTGKKIGRITALDAAGPAWEHPELEKEHQLNKEDANFVDVHHSDIHVFGYAKPMGHADFYPNGGKDQPGTTEESEQRDNSNHDRAVWYFVESVTSKVNAVEADFKEVGEWKFEITPKVHGKQVIFKENIAKLDGVYYFETGNKRPFLK